MSELWGGRFSRPPTELAREFNASIGVDQRLWLDDILGSIAHCRMLGTTGIISESESATIIAGLVRVAREIERGDFSFKIELEDIHLNIEARLTALVGSVAGKLHTARSRNDQVALDLRLHTKRVIVGVGQQLIRLQTVFLERAAELMGVPIPGYTHLQRAQPVLLSHHFLAYFEMFQRDLERLRDSLARVDVSPLGSGALAGVPYPIDRHAVATELGFAAISRNSLDAVSDRDFIIETVADFALAMNHLSRFAEEVVLWTTFEFGFAELDDAFATGSSIMPQKKNPDLAELVRGKSGRIVGALVSLLTLTKALPLSYNKDLQEDKPNFFDAADTLFASLEVTAALLRSLRVRAGRLADTAAENFSLATEYADYLARRGVPFRQAHEIVGRLVSLCISGGRDLSDLTLDELRAHSLVFAPDALLMNVQTGIESRDVPGGTSSRRVEEAIDVARLLIRGNEEWVESVRRSLPTLPTDETR